MTKTELMTSEEIVLAAESELASQNSSSFSVVREGEIVATETVQPADAHESGDGENPVPVSGFANIAGMTDEDDNDLIAASDSPGLEFALEAVIGPDGRARVNNTGVWPWRVHGHMRMRYPNGRTYIGSGTMVNRHHVLTAGHNVYSRANGGWATAVSFQAARNDSTLPFGTAQATRLLSVTGWTNNNDSRYDMGMLILGRDLGNQTGWMGVITGPDSLLLRYRVNVSGYPADKGGHQMWTMADVIKAVQAERVYYDIDTYGGQSGSGVWSTWSGHTGEKVCSIHTTGSQSGNGATRISRPKFDRILDWFSRY